MVTWLSWILCAGFIITACLNIRDARKMKQEVEKLLSNTYDGLLLLDKTTILLNEMEQYLADSKDCSCSGKFHEIVERWREIKE